MTLLRKTASKMERGIVMNIKNFESQYGDSVSSNVNISHSHIRGDNVRIGGINEGR